MPRPSRALPWHLRYRYGPEALDAVFRIQPERRRDLGYQELLPHSIELDIDISERLRIRVLDLETLIAIKEQLGGEKDRAVLPILRRTLQEKRKAQ